MNNTTILKLLELLEQDNKQAIKEILTSEMLNSTDKKAQIKPIRAKSTAVE